MPHDSYNSFSELTPKDLNITFIVVIIIIIQVIIINDKLIKFFKKE